MWVFGYGSLVWRADFPYVTKVMGYVKGYHRRFYQHSVDHRGRPDRPGRVATLIKADDDDKVWGAAFEVLPKDEAQVTAYLDYREKNGYTRQVVLFYPMYIMQDNCDRGQGVKHPTQEPFSLTIYIASEDNAHYAGPAPIQDIARQIYASEGPSGSNKEYLYMLAHSIRSAAPDAQDDHLFSLEKAVQAIESEQC